ncbi:MAG: Penicillin-resistant dd-carboxypeptidase-like protein [Parcubacteria group bacterium]|nr:Penicillin-resistant dd-carboxypeptidase-like protein [Parcubacteria group bacterium]
MNTPFKQLVALITLVAFVAGPFSAFADEEAVLAPEPVIETATEVSTTTPEVATTEPEVQAPEEEIIEQPVIDPDTYVAGEVLVKFKDKSVDLSEEAGEETSTDLAASLDLEQKDLLTDQNIAVYSSQEDSVDMLLSKLEADPNVEYAEPNFVRSIEALSTTTDPFADRLWGLENTGQVVNGITGTDDADTDAEEAWALSTGQDVVVAVIDTGVNFAQADLAGSMWDGSNCVDENGVTIVGGCLHGYDFKNNDNNPTPSGSGTDLIHGTHVAGTIAATKGNGLGIIGIAPNAKIMALRFDLDTASEVRAIDFAIQNGAKIINASFSGSAPSAAEEEAIQRFEAAGGIFVAAAANGAADQVGDNLDNFPFIESASNTPAYPAQYTTSNIISVAATGQNDNLATFSNYGEDSVDIGAPGVNILSTVIGGYSYLSGTSMAAPHVAGAVALVEALHPEFSTDEVIDLILSSGDPLPALSGKTVSGKRLNVYNALYTSSLDTIAPIITILGDNPLSLTVGIAFTDPGATSTDNIDGDLTSSIVVSGAVDTSTVGSYTLSYVVSDVAGNTATSTRLVNVTAVVSSGGGGGGGGGGSSKKKKKGGGGGGTTTTKVTSPSVPRLPQTSVVTAPTPTVLGATTSAPFIFTLDLAIGSQNSEVLELQKTLTTLGLFTVAPTGYFGPVTQAAVMAYQGSHGISPIGRVGPLTRASLNLRP